MCNKKFLKYVFIVLAGLVQLSLADTLFIHNLGHTGFDQIHPEYTSIRTVYLKINYSSQPVECRYANHNSSINSPEQGSSAWTYWEPCFEQKYWTLSDYAGIKYVYVQINYSSSIVLLNDSIFYNSTGAGLDVTPPTTPDLKVKRYQNDNESIVVKWEKSNDYESEELLHIPLIYEIKLFNDSFELIKNDTTKKLKYTFSNLSLSHRENITVNVTAVNSAGLKSNSSSQKISIDLVSPYLTSIDLAEFLNSTSKIFQPVSQDVWINTEELRFSWSGYDSDSGVYAFSYHLSEKNKSPDNIPEGDIGGFSSETSHRFYHLNTGIFYFTVMSRDTAGNWDNNFDSQLIKIDKTPPKRPEIISKKYNAKTESLTFYWSGSEDDESGISYYRVNVSDQDDVFVESFIVNDTTGTLNNTLSQKYKAIVGVKNGAGIWKWSNQKEAEIDSDAPEINSFIEGVINSNNPIISIETDEKSSCRYKMPSGKYQLFRFTNSTYHEDIINVLDGLVNIEINCSDRYGNYNDTFAISFNVDTSYEPYQIEMPDNLTTYQDSLFSFSVNVTSDNSTLLSGIPFQDWSFKISGKDQLFSIFDAGSGKYNVYFIPPLDPGNYQIELCIRENVCNSKLINVFAVSLETKFVTDEALSVQTTEKISYHKDSEKFFGLASDDRNTDPDPSKIKINSSLNNNIFIFSSFEKTPVLHKDKYLKNKEFLKKTAPNFGSSFIEIIKLNSILKYEDIKLVTDNNILVRQSSKKIRLKKTHKDGKRAVKIDSLT
ncbi:hypothetical protein GF327_03120 [Candidatus Woesearchaeota archaeon]|nr:hypothetical protein [Candidatus Woesearchaeota archaeon]